MKSSRAGLALTILTLLVAVLAIGSVQPPPVAPEDAPDDQFSALRGRGYLEAIAQEPHAMGTAEHDRVLHYVVEQVAGLGLEPEIQETTVVSRPRGGVVAGRVRNVIVRLPGRERGKALLLVSHYDTVPQSPGASDDSTGVAALLETLRILRQGPPLKNDVIFLFTDGEEVALLGAQAFLKHPWAREVRMVVNLEARGTRGPALMFQTSAGNGRLIRTFRDAVEHPMATSFSYEVYKVMPNDTDFTVFNRAGMAGLNFAFIHGGTAYHTLQDSLRRLDLRSFQHQGESLLALAREFGDADLDRLEGGNAVYFNLFGYYLVAYPELWVLPLTILLVVATAGLLYLGRRRGRISVGGTVLALLANVLGVVVVAVLLFLLAPLLVNESYNFTLGEVWTSTSLYQLGFALLALGLTLALRSLVGRKLSAGNRVAGGILTWLLLALSVTFLAPGASYLFALPLLLGVAATAALWRSGSSEERVAALPLALLALTAVVAALLWAPALALIGVALGLPGGLIIAIALFLLLFGPLSSQLDLTMPRRRVWLLSLIPVLLGLAVVFSVRQACRFDSDNRRPDSVLYVLDAEEGKASWLSYDQQGDEWTSQFLSPTPEKGAPPAFLGLRDRPMLMSPAPVIPLPGAAVEILSEEVGAQGRVVHLAITWPWDVERALLALRSPGPIHSVRVDEEAEWPQDEEGYRLTYYAPPAEGIRLRVEMAAGQALEVEATGQRFRLPEAGDVPTAPRPADRMPRREWSVDSTFVRNVTTLLPGDKETAPATSPPEPSAPEPGD